MSEVGTGRPTDAKLEALEGAERVYQLAKEDGRREARAERDEQHARALAETGLELAHDHVQAALGILHRHVPSIHVPDRARVELELAEEVLGQRLEAVREEGRQP